MHAVPLNYYLILSAIVFSVGVTGVLVRRNLIVVLMSIELMLNAVNLTFIAFSRFHGSMEGQVAVFFVMAVAAAEAGKHVMCEKPLATTSARAMVNSTVVRIIIPPVAGGAAIQYDARGGGNDGRGRCTCGVHRGPGPA